MVREHGSSTKQVLPVVPVTTGEPLTTMEVTCQAPRVCCGEAERKVSDPSELPSPPVAGSDAYRTG